MKRLIVFDVNETLLDLSALDAQFERLFGTTASRTAWFSQVIQNSFFHTITGRYHHFGDIAGAALDMIAARHGVELVPEDRAAILGGIRKLPPHPDITPAFDRLRAAGFRLFALTNSPPPVLEAQLQNAGLAGYFEKTLSVDAVRAFKPSEQVYRMAAERLGVRTADILMVAAHDWDVAGAMCAGCSAAFVARPGMVLNPLMPRPEIVEPDMIRVAARIIEAAAGPG